MITVFTTASCVEPKKQSISLSLSLCVCVCVCVCYGQPTFHIARLSIASTSSPSSIAKIMTHRGMAKETSGMAHTTNVPILKTQAQRSLIFDYH